jgi:hypothetical protein
MKPAPSCSSAAIAPATTTPAPSPHPTEEEKDDTITNESFDNVLDVDVDPAEDDNTSSDPMLSTFFPRLPPSITRRTAPTASRNAWDNPPLTTSPEGPPVKIRRVEKPVRFRVHWTCHECERTFGYEQDCIHCGHRKCTRCVRHPPKRARETPRTLLQEGIRALAAFNAVTTEQQADEYTAAAEPETPHYLLQSLGGIDSDDSDEYQPDFIPDNYEYSFYRSTAALQRVFNKAPNMMHRTCHVCSIQMLNSQSDCPGCGHTKCEQCPRSPPKGKSIQPSEDETSPFHMQRIYRKPRQRVRFTCEHCNALFTGHDRCRQCGHNRCDECHRDP